MGRQKRIWSPHHFYHVIFRGNRRDALFKDETDFQVFFYIIKKVYEKAPFEVVSYCLMTNHYHLQIHSQNQPLSKVMSLINKKYANYYNTKYNLTGHVYEKRFYDKRIDSNLGMLKVSRYIHLNPVEAKMVKWPDDYEWSSYGLYTGMAVPEHPFLRPKLLWDFFSGSLCDQQTGYTKFVIQKIGLGS